MRKSPLNLPACSVLFARSDSVYFEFSDVDVWDVERDARLFRGRGPVVAHPPCRAWGRLRKQANPRADEKALALFAVEQVRRCGGVLEHPAGSTLWPAAGLPACGERDVYGGWTYVVSQRWFGHRAEKLTSLYIVGCAPADLPRVDFALGRASHVVGGSGRRVDGSRLHKGDAGWRPDVGKAEREATPRAFAAWLLALAKRCRPVGGSCNA